ncbi:hypothetical protein Tco_1377454 [Tanacetum coccineum]
MTKRDHHDPNTQDMKPWKWYCFHKFTTSSCYGKDVTEMQSLVCTDDELQTKKIIKFRLGRRAHSSTLLEFAQILGLYQAVELEEDGFNVYFEGGLRNDDNFNTQDYWLSISREDNLGLSRSHTFTIRRPILRVIHKMITYGLCQRKTGWMKRKRAGTQKESQICCGQFISKLARKCRVLTEDVVKSLSAPIYCRDLDTTTLRDLIDSDGKLIPEDPQPGVPRVGIPRPPRASMQDLYDRMEIRQEVIERMEYSFDKLVEDFWNEAPVLDTNAMIKMMKKLKYLKEKIRGWNKKNKEDFRNNKCNLKNELAELDLVIDKGEVTKDEMKKAVWDYGIEKSPGLDGFTFSFYRRYWKIMESDVVDASKKKQSLVFKVDFEKAYDSVRWDFLDDILRRFESLHISFQRVVDADMFNGITLSSSLHLSHMFYVDDVIFVGKWNDSNINIIVPVLECFHRASGLRINMSKSKLLGIFVDADKVDQTAMKIGCVTLKTSFTYLGSKVGGLMSRIQSSKETIEGMVTRLSKWKMKTLSIGGRSTLIKSPRGGVERVQFDAMVEKVEGTLHADMRDRWTWLLLRRVGLRRCLSRLVGVDFKLAALVKHKQFFEGVCYAMWWHIWSFRNKCVFDSEFPSKAVGIDHQQTSAVTTAMTAILKQFQATPPPASVKSVEEICVTCGGPHPYYQCLAADGNTFPKYRDNIQGYVAAATALIQQNQSVPLKELEKFKKINDVNMKATQAQINNVKNELRNEMQSSIQTSMSNQTNELKNMMASFFQMNTASTSGLGSFPSNTVANTKGELKAITTQSGLVLNGHTVPMPPPFINSEEDERV